MSGKCSNCGTQYFGTELTSCQLCGFALTPHAMNPDSTTPAPEGPCYYCGGPHRSLQCPKTMAEIVAEPPAQSLPQGTTGVDAAKRIARATAEKIAFYNYEGRRLAIEEAITASLAALQRENEKLQIRLEEFTDSIGALSEMNNIKIEELDRLRSSLATKDAQIVELRKQFAGAVEIGKSHRDEADALRAELSALIAESMSISEGCESRIAALKTECERLKKEVDQARATRRAFVKLAKDHHAKITANNKALTARAEAAEKARDRWMSACDITAGERDAALALVETCRKSLDKIANDERVGPWQSNPGLNERHIAKNVLASLPVAGTDKRTTPDRSNWTQDDAEEAKLP